MRIKPIITAAIVAACLGGGVVDGSAQARKALRINEVMVDNASNFVDDFGERNAWIELFNSNFAPLEISSVYLTTDPQNPTMYPVPLGDVNTRIPKRQHIIFWADGNPSRGTFHTNFRLLPGQPNWIGIYDADGRTLIDSVTVPAYIPVDMTYARRADGLGEGPDAWELRTGTESSVITPSSNNIIKDGNHKVAGFRQMDANGFGMTVTAMLIVFSALFVLCMCFYFISSIGKKRSKKKKLAAQGIDLAAGDQHAATEGDTGEQIAAICMALNEHLNAHDLESTILTISKVRKNYSPWSSRIYQMRHVPEQPTHQR